LFIPNNAVCRADFIRPTNGEEVFDGTVIQPLPGNATNAHAEVLSQLPALSGGSQGSRSGVYLLIVVAM
jgi:hypothetical protein